ncbi:hypothetical protein HETIRDRAFT_452069 [Heterobasidion irregulare TC 32-1]|uniref:Uncharacterized protein n=1 Tax=Heterobasidion irregulare (strain TC 32-1) TaxID=747525 RepID=W4K600_HETIT|nr:uncharacterized protein HETIRDRAFT_452069 [Heterobasidion irregulare TC 32-1]ETW80481.1 hypothetical protein HETIRDRAFT_452069 [Heterobasidion irregulare TC 32-1]
MLREGRRVDGGLCVDGGKNTINSRGGWERGERRVYVGQEEEREEEREEEEEKEEEEEEEGIATVDLSVSLVRVRHAMDDSPDETDCDHLLTPLFLSAPSSQPGCAHRRYPLSAPFPLPPRTSHPLPSLLLPILSCLLSAYVRSPIASDIANRAPVLFPSYTISNMRPQRILFTRRLGPPSNVPISAFFVMAYIPASIISVPAASAITPPLPPLQASSQ